MESVTQLRDVIARRDEDRRRHTWLRVAGICAVAGSVLALAAEAMMPRADRVDGPFLARVSGGAGAPLACLLGGLAVLLAAVGLLALTDLAPGRLSGLGRGLLLPVGVALALVEAWGTAPALRLAAQDVRAGVGADQRTAFWTARGIGQLDGMLSDAWALVLLGLLPALLAAALWRTGWPRWPAALAWVGAALSAAAAAGDLAGLPVDLRLVQVAGAVCVMAWLGVSGGLLLRLGRRTPLTVATRLRARR